jgi:anti-sigma B factor antagonist
LETRGSMDSAGSADVADHRKAEQDFLLVRAVEASLADPLEDGASLVAGIWNPWDGLMVVALVGEMDMGNAAELTHTVDQRVGPDQRHLIVELSRLTFIDSTGIQKLIRIAEDFMACGGTVVLAGPTHSVSRAFDLMMLDQLVVITDSLEHALDHLSGAESPRLRVVAKRDPDPE